MDAPLPGGLGGTYAGNPLACAAAIAVLDVFREEKLVERAAVLGDQIRAGLLALQARFPQIDDIARGLRILETALEDASSAHFSYSTPNASSTFPGRRPNAP